MLGVLNYHLSYPELSCYKAFISRFETFNYMEKSSKAEEYEKYILNSPICSSYLVGFEWPHS